MSSDNDYKVRTKIYTWTLERGLERPQDMPTNITELPVGSIL